MPRLAMIAHEINGQLPSQQKEDISTFCIYSHPNSGRRLSFNPDNRLGHCSFSVIGELLKIEAVWGIREHDFYEKGTSYATAVAVVVLGFAETFRHSEMKEAWEANSPLL